MRGGVTIRQSAEIRSANFENSMVRYVESLLVAMITGTRFFAWSTRTSAKRYRSPSLIL